MLDPCRVLLSVPAPVKAGLESMQIEKNLAVQLSFESFATPVEELESDEPYDIAVIYCIKCDYHKIVQQIIELKNNKQAALFDRFILLYDEYIDVDFSSAWAAGMYSHVSTSNIKNLYCCIEAVAPIINNHRKVSRDLKEASDIALLSMSASSQLGEVLRFMEKSFDCEAYDDLADLTAQTLQQMGVEAYGLMETKDGWHYFGKDVEKEAWQRLLLHFREGGRYIDIQLKTIINFSRISILARNMPDPNSEAYGRVKEVLFMLADGVNARCIAIEHEIKSKESDRARNIFMSVVSHELRSPMNTIIGFSHYLNKKREGHALQKRDLEAISKLEEKSEELLEMINNLLEISEIQSEQEVKYRRSVIREVLFQIILDTEKEAIENGLQFEIIWQDETIVADTDVKRLKHIVRQILQNAVKFTCEGKVSIEVKAVTDCPENEKLLIAVADTGVGIEPEVQRRIFTPFSQLNVRLSHHQSGMGMGLAIAAQFCHDMGGEISLESEPGKGSLFSVELPLIRSLEEVKVKLPPKEIELF